MDFPGDSLTCKGTVVKKYQQNGENVVECDVYIENGKGERTTYGSATVQLPSRTPML